MSGVNEVYTKLVLKYLFNPLKKSCQIPPGLPLKREEKQVSPLQRGILGLTACILKCFPKH
jgi:hypothetical protein